MQAKVTSCSYFSERVYFNGYTYHTNISKAEGHPGRIRVISPNYLVFTENDTFTSNYSTQASIVMVTEPNTTATTPLGKYFDLVFPAGFTYPDIITFNFSLTVDPNESRLPGAGVTTSNVLFSPVMERQVVDSYPAAADAANLHPFGEPVAVPVTVDAPECMGMIAILNECQVTASSQMSSTTKPFNAKQVELDGRAWSPALRTGKGWRDFVDFDLLENARINRVTVGRPGFSGFRSITKLKVQTSLVKDYFQDAKEHTMTAAAGSYDNITFSTPVWARYVRILVVEVDDNYADSQSIGINK